MMTPTTKASSFYLTLFPLRSLGSCSAPRSAKWPAIRVVCASSEGRAVDEGMVVLRMRIHEAKARDGDNKHALTRSDWMEWERKYYDTSYRNDVCEAVGALQSKLMSARPSSVLAALTLLSLSVPVSLGVILVHLAGVAKQVVGFGL